MKKSFVLAFLVCGLFLLYLSDLNLNAQTPATVDETNKSKKVKSTKLLINNAKIVDVKRNKILSRSVLVENGKVKKRYRKPPENFNGKTIDIKGKWIIPGLFDMHVHSSSNKTLKYKDMPPIKTENSARWLQECYRPKR